MNIRLPVISRKFDNLQFKMSTTTESKEVKDLKDIKEKIDLGLLEEDDEFEEFQAEGKLKFDLILI